MTTHSIPSISAEEKDGDVIGSHPSLPSLPRAKLKALSEVGTAQLDPEWINVDELRLWIETCDGKHDGCKHAFEAQGWPLWLIDVEKLCVVPAARGDTRYMALSYVWGQVESSELTKENMDALQKPSSLSLDSKDVTIPQTIRHAMGLVKLLSCRYLWVDRFCICQDDTTSKHAQIAQMADIYANSYVTIIAANGWDANHGLRGIRGVTEPRQISKSVGRDYLEALQPFTSIWYSRGWTFQELFFSRRKIFFQYQVAVWECGRELYHESAVVGSDPDGARDTAALAHVPASMSPWGVSLLPAEPDLDLYFKMVRHYNMRELIFAEDGYKAFQGVTTSLSRVFKGGFTWGLPNMYFHQSLLWFQTDTAKRRIVDDSAESIPSWSWVGWQGSIDLVAQHVQGWEPDTAKRSFLQGFGKKKPPPTLWSKIRPACSWRLVGGNDRPSPPGRVSSWQKKLLGKEAVAVVPSPDRDSHLLAITGDVARFKILQVKDGLYAELVLLDGTDAFRLAKAHSSRRKKSIAGRLLGVYDLCQTGDLVGRICDIVLIARSDDLVYQFDRMPDMDESVFFGLWYSVEDGRATRLGVAMVSEDAWHLARGCTETLVFE